MYRTPPGIDGVVLLVLKQFTCLVSVGQQCRVPIRTTTGAHTPLLPTSQHCLNFVPHVGHSVLRHGIGMHGAACPCMRLLFGHCAREAALAREVTSICPGSISEGDNLCFQLCDKTTRLQPSCAQDAPKSSALPSVLPVACSDASTSDSRYVCAMIC